MTQPVASQKRLLERLGCEVRYAELPCGHDLVGWGGSIADGLQHLLGAA